MRLSEYARRLGLSHRAAWEQYHRGEIDGAYQLKSGTIIVPDSFFGISETSRRDTVVYARVSSPANKSNLLSQVDRVSAYCAANGWVVSRVVTDFGSGLNDSRRGLLSLLQDPTVARIVVEHKDRLTRFGFNYIKALWPGDLVVINNVERDEDDLMQDFVSLVTSFTARLYGRRRCRRRTEALIKELESVKD